MKRLKIFSCIRALLALLLFLPGQVFSVANQAASAGAHAGPLPGVGDFAEGLLGPVSVLSGFVASASMLIGISFMLATIVHFRRYRANPMAYPLTGVLTLGFFALILMLLPLIYRLAGGGFSPKDFG